MTNSPYDNLPSGKSETVSMPKSAIEMTSDASIHTLTSETAAKVPEKSAKGTVQYSAKEAAAENPKELAKEAAAENMQNAAKETAKEAVAENMQNAAKETLEYIDVEIDGDVAPSIENVAPSIEKIASPIKDVASSISETVTSIGEKPLQSSSDYNAQDIANSKRNIVQKNDIPSSMRDIPSPARDIPSKPIRGQQHTHISTSGLGETHYYTLPFEETLLVPDTMPDMHSVLFAEGKAVLSQPAKSSYTKNDFISGDITVYTVYRPEPAGSPVDVIKSSIPFKTDKCWDDTNGDTFKVTVRIKSIRSEMINERKFVVKGEILFTINDILQKELNLFKEADDISLVCAKDRAKITGIAFELKETTEISQEINIAAEQPAPVKILKQHIHITETHKQITSGKLVINAVIHSQILYTGLKDDTPQLACQTNKTEFTQFIPVSENTDIRLVRTQFDDSNLKISVENQNQFMLSGDVTTYICGCQNSNIETVCDAYHKTHEIRCEKTAHEIICVSDTVSGEISAREVISIDENASGSQNQTNQSAKNAHGSQNQTNQSAENAHAAPSPQTLLCGSAEIEEIEARNERGKIVIEGSVIMKILALDENSNAFVIEKSVPLRGALETSATDTQSPGSCEISATVENLIPDITSQIRNFWFDKINLRQIEVNVSVGIEVWLKRKSTPECIEKIYINEDCAPLKPLPLTVYVTGNGDTLWNIAKKYRSDAATLASVNRLDASQPIAEGTKLLIAHI